MLNQKNQEWENKLHEIVNNTGWNEVEERLKQFIYTLLIMEREDAYTKAKTESKKEKVNEINYMKGFNSGINKALEILESAPHIATAEKNVLKRKLMLLRHYDF